MKLYCYWQPSPILIKLDGSNTNCCVYIGRLIYETVTNIVHLLFSDCALVCVRARVFSLWAFLFCILFTTPPEYRFHGTDLSTSTWYSIRARFNFSHAIQITNRIEKVFLWIYWKFDPFSCDKLHLRMSISRTWWCVTLHFLYHSYLLRTFLCAAPKTILGT